jgi:hypothetical protein
VVDGPNRLIGPVVVDGPNRLIGPVVVAIIVGAIVCLPKILMMVFGGTR